MLDRAFSVSPPQVDLKSDPKPTLPNEKDSADLKNEFESHFKTPGGIKQRAKQDESSRVAKKNKEDEKGEQNKLSKKKKKIEDPQATLNLMASKENDNKVPDTEENLEFAIENLTENQNDISSELKGNQLLADMALSDESNQAETPATDSEIISPEPSFEDQVKLSLNQDQFNETLDSMVQDGLDTVESSAELDSQPEASVLQVNTTDLKSEVLAQSAKEQESFQSGEDADSQPSSDFKAKDMKSHHAGQTDFSHQFKSEVNVSSTQSTQDTAAANHEEKIKSLESVYQQAKFLVQRGGGEVTVKMSPEGMGDIHLKVMLQNGNVQLEVNTQDRNVKKLIEDHISDLKSSLAAHQMNVEHVKVSTVAETNTENKSRFESGEQFNGQFNDQLNQHQQSASQGFSGRQQRPYSPEYLEQPVQINVANIKKAVGQRVYENNKAQTLDRIA